LTGVSLARSYFRFFPLLAGVEDEEDEEGGGGGGSRGSGSEIVVVGACCLRKFERRWRWSSAFSDGNFFGWLWCCRAAARFFPFNVRAISAVTVAGLKSVILAGAEGSMESAKAVFAAPVRYSSHLFLDMAFSCCRSLPCSFCSSRARACDCCDVWRARIVCSVLSI